MSTIYYKCKNDDCQHTWSEFYMGLNKPPHPKCPRCNTIHTKELIKAPPPNGTYNVRAGFNL